MNPLLSMVHLFVADDARAEVRVLGEQVLIGRSAKPATLARMIERGDGHGNVYVTLNPLRPELPDRPLGPLGRGQQAATDADVMRYRWLPIDLDARAAHAERRPATAAERDAVAAVANALTSYLVTELRWPAPVVGDSGNGTWLLFPIDVPTGARVLIESTLKTLGRRVGTEAVTIDPVVGNPSRIVRAFGTVNRRAQRRSRLVAMPVRDDVLTVRDLERVQEEAEGPRTGPGPGGRMVPGRRSGVLLVCAREPGGPEGARGMGADALRRSGPALPRRLSRALPRPRPAPRGRPLHHPREHQGLRSPRPRGCAPGEADAG
jgi:hypothetical protein